MHSLSRLVVRFAAAAGAASCLVAGCATAPTAAPSDAPPDLRVDATWPKRLPNRWLLGQVAGVATDADDHVWVLQRPGSLTDDERGATFDPPLSDCCAPAPPVLEFDGDGNLLRSWGGRGPGYDWPQNEHGIHVDAAGYVWISGNGENDGQLLKFTRDGRFLMQIGKVGPQTGNRDTSRLGQAAGIEVDLPANEVYVADGYYNQRVIVFDATTGAFKRMWGAYGRRRSTRSRTCAAPRPPTATQLETFGNPVHCVRLAHDGLVYVCDRLNNRVQVFHKDGTYVKRVLRRAGHRGQRLGVGHRLVARSGPALAARRRRPQQHDPHAAARERRRGRPHSAGRAAMPASSTGSTTSRSIRTATSTPARSTPASACRSSCRAEGHDGDAGHGRDDQGGAPAHARRPRPPQRASRSVRHRDRLRRHALDVRGVRRRRRRASRRASRRAASPRATASRSSRATRTRSRRCASRSRGSARCSCRSTSC